MARVVDDGWVDLLRDLGASGARRTARDDSEEALLRLADDPILLRQFLLRGGERVKLPLPLVDPAALALGVRVATSGVRPAWRDAVGQASDGGSHSSVWPEVFEPTTEDRSNALNAGGDRPMSRTESDPSRLRAWRWFLLAASVAAICLALRIDS